MEGSPGVGAGCAVRHIEWYVFEGIPNNKTEIDVVFDKQDTGGCQKIKSERVNERKSEIGPLMRIDRAKND